MDSPISGSFSATDFRTAIQNAMLMGLPNATPDVPTFYWPDVVTYPAGTALDEQGKPYDLTVVPNITKTTPVQPLCAVEFQSQNSDQVESVGQFDKGIAVITILDTDYATIKGATSVTLGGNHYNILYVEPPVGLFTVTVYRIHVEAVDET